jgi:hypothetical protein
MLGKKLNCFYTLKSASKQSWIIALVIYTAPTVYIEFSFHLKGSRISLSLAKRWYGLIENN